MQYRFPVTRKDQGAPLCRFLAEKASLSRGEALALVRFGAVWVDRDRQTDGNRTLAAGEEVTLNVPRHGVRRSYETAEARILYEDPWILAYDKEPGIPCQPTPYDAYNNVYEALRRRIAREGEGPGGRVPEGGQGSTRGEPSPAATERPPGGGPPAGYLALHHRLDLGVSGVMVFARSVRANAPLFEAFRDRKVEKVYVAVVSGPPPADSWVEKAPIGRQGGRYLCTEPGKGKEAETAFRVVQRSSGLALVEARPRTGRTHQIRLHLALSGVPVLGDAQYGGRRHARVMLHAHRVTLPHPVTGERLAIEAPVPAVFREALGLCTLP